MGKREKEREKRNFHYPLSATIRANPEAKKKQHRKKGKRGV